MTEHTTTALTSPLIAAYGDSSGDYAAMLTPGGTGFWQWPDGIYVATWRDATEAEEAAIHYAGDDEAARYAERVGDTHGPEDVLLFGSLDDFGIADGDLIIASPRLTRMIHVTVQWPDHDRTHLHVTTADGVEWCRTCDRATADCIEA